MHCFPRVEVINRIVQTNAILLNCVCFVSVCMTVCECEERQGWKGKMNYMKIRGEERGQ